MNLSFKDQKFWIPNKVWDSHLHQDEKSIKFIKVYKIISQLESDCFINKTLFEISKMIRDFKKENLDSSLKKLRIVSNLYYDGREHHRECFLVGERRETDIEYEQRQEILRNAKTE